MSRALPLWQHFCQHDKSEQCVCVCWRGACVFRLRSLTSKSHCGKCDVGFATYVRLPHLSFECGNLIAAGRIKSSWASFCSCRRGLCWLNNPVENFIEMHYWVYWFVCLYMGQMRVFLKSETAGRRSTPDVYLLSFTQLLDVYGIVIMLFETLNNWAGLVLSDITSDCTKYMKKRGLSSGVY